jgi:hypothetical protein
VFAIIIIFFIFKKYSKNGFCFCFCSCLVWVERRGGSELLYHHDIIDSFGSSALEWAHMTPSRLFMCFLGRFIGIVSMIFMLEHGKLIFSWVGQQSQELLRK